MSNGTQLWQNPSAIMTFADGDPNEIPWVIGPPGTEEIEISPYSSEWPDWFAASKAAIAAALPGKALKIEHVGSTAVPLLAAKPIIDIDLIVTNPEDENDYVPPLAALGYALTVRERSWYQHRMLRHAKPRINLHVFGPNCPEHLRHLLFRDWLREHPEDRDLYVRAKEEARIGVHNVQDYNRQKQSVIRSIYQKIFESRGWASAVEPLQ